MKAILLGLVGLLGATLAPAASFAADPAIKVDAVWARATAPGMTTGALYFSLTNAGSESDRLVRVETGVAAEVELHESREENGVMVMRGLPGVDVPPGASVVFKPGGMHAMLLGLTGPLTAGTTFPATLVFEHAGPITVDVPVGTDAPSGGAGMDTGKMPMGGMDHMHE